MTEQILLAGFGGQGILFAGKVLAYLALNKGQNVSWLPSYGPEMRGGTANCNVIISDSEIASPIVESPTILIAMNKPSYTKFAEKVQTGGKIFVDSSLISGVSGIPATELASQNGHKNLANMVLLGKVLSETKLYSFEEVEAVFKQIIPPNKPDLVELNMKMIKLGAES